MAKSAPKCCNRTMSRQGAKYVCSRCRGWVDLGLVLVSYIATRAGGR